MAKFFAGLRVKLVKPAHPENIGKTGVISAMFEERAGNVYSVNCDVNWDDFLPAGFASVTHTDRLEPILPEGHKPCEESFKEELDNEFLKERETVKA